MGALRATCGGAETDTGAQIQDQWRVLRSKTDNHIKKLSAINLPYCRCTYVQFTTQYNTCRLPVLEESPGSKRHEYDIVGSLPSAALCPSPSWHVPQGFAWGHTCPGRLGQRLLSVVSFATLMARGYHSPAHSGLGFVAVLPPLFVATALARRSRAGARAYKRKQNISLQQRLLPYLNKQPLSHYLTMA